MRAALRFAVVAVGAAALSQAATLARYPYLQNVRSDRATILWTTLESVSSSSVQYSTDRSFSRSAPARVREFLPAETGLVFPYFQHEAELAGLSAGTQYFYRVIADGENMTPGDELRFRTAGTTAFRFLALGDSGQGSVAQRQIAARMIQEEVALVLHTGDIAYPDGTFSDFQARYFDIYRDLMKRVPIFPTPGNHEYHTRNAAPYLAMHSVPTEGVPAADRGRYYSFDWGNVHFVSLDSNAPLVNAVNGAGRMLDWLENDLQRTRRFWRVVYFHHAPYALGGNDNDPETRELTAMVRQRVLPILEGYDVALVLTGHEHSYQRSWFIRNGTPFTESGSGTLYITTGGGGGSLYPVKPSAFLAFGESAYHYLRGEVQGSRLTLRAIRPDGREIDTITLAPVPLISSDSTVNAASFTPSLAPGALVSIFGRSLAVEEILASSLPLPTELSGINVTLNGRRLPLLYVSGTQINTQLLFDVRGRATLRVNTPNGFSEALVTISEAAPAIFSASTDFGRLPAVVHSSGTLVSTASPAEPGETVLVFLTGLGQVNGEIAAGQPAPFSPLLSARVPVEAQLGGAAVTPSFAGLAPGFAGLYQVNLPIPELPSGTYTLRIVAGGISSNVVGVAVRSSLRETGPTARPSQRQASP